MICRSASSVEACIDMSLTENRCQDKPTSSLVLVIHNFQGLFLQKEMDAMPFFLDNKLGGPVAFH